VSNFIEPSPADLARIHVSCEGLYPGMQFVCFTDRDPVSPACGASFDLQLPVYLTHVQAALAAKRLQFAAALS
jgi:hypothetical protein